MLKHPFFILAKPAKTYTYILQNTMLWFTFNITLIIVFASIYQAFDKEEKSMFNGLSDINQRGFSDYLYFSIIINTTLGLGEIVPIKDNSVQFRSRQRISRSLVATHIMSSLLINDALDSFENLKLS